MFGVILKATNSSFQKGMLFCRSIYTKKVMKLPEYEYELIDALKTGHTNKRCYSPRCQNLNCGLPFYTLS